MLSQREMDRLDMAHLMFTRAIGGELFLAPIDKDKVQKVLDIGTGTALVRHPQAGVW
jgi:tRNA1(Val) A37 N6-methylase TrmN6